MRRAVLRESPKRAGERSGQHPGKRQAEQQRDRAHSDEHEDVPAHPVADGLDALRHPDGADAPAVVDHRNRREEQVLAEGVAPPLALGRPTRQRLTDLGPVAVRGEP